MADSIYFQIFSGNQIRTSAPLSFETDVGRERPTDLPGHSIFWREER